MNAITTTPQGGLLLPEDIEKVVVGGDLSPLTPEQRVAYVKAVCESVGLNPLTKPFEYIKLNGKLVLYALKGATDQLRQVHGVSIRVVHQAVQGGLFIVTVEATDKAGRVDTDMGVVPLGNAQGESAANAMMKALTKAKRRVTLSICGLGMLDESEVETIPGARPAFQSDVSTPVLAAVAAEEKATRRDLLNSINALIGSLEIDGAKAQEIVGFSLKGASISQLHEAYKKLEEYAELVTPIDVEPQEVA